MRTLDGLCESGSGVTGSDIHNEYRCVYIRMTSSESIDGCGRGGDQALYWEVSKFCHVEDSTSSSRRERCRDADDGCVKTTVFGENL